MFFKYVVITTNKHIFKSSRELFKTKLFVPVGLWNRNLNVIEIEEIWRRNNING